MREVELDARFREYAAIITDVTTEDLALLTAFERARLDSFHSPKRKVEWAAARIAAKSVSIRRGLARSDEDFVASDSFPPRWGEMWLSFSHSTYYGAAAVDRERVGIDLERPRRVEPRLTKFFLHPDEIELCVPSIEDHLIHLWAAKEAAFKFTGTATLLKDVRFSSCSGVSGGLSLTFECLGFSGIATTIAHEEGFVLALAR